MLRGSLVVFNGIFSCIFLKQRLYPHHIAGILIIVAGTVVVGLSSVLNGHADASAARNPLLGINNC